MRKFLIFFVLAIFRVESADGRFHCERINIATPIARLYSHLDCGRDRPSFNETNPTIIDIRMIPTYIELVESKDQLNFFAWVHMSWLEPKFTWEPEKYDNIKEIYVKDGDIWTPELQIWNHEVHGDRDTKMASRECLVFFNGTINCVVPTKFSSTCSPDYSDWPYDKHYCNIFITGHPFTEYPRILMRLTDSSILMDEFTPNQQWFAHISYVDPLDESLPFTDTKQLIIIYLTLERRGSRLAIVYILPIVVLMIMTLIVLCLDSQSIDRVMVASVNIIGHLFGLSDLHYYFPINESESMPKLLTFYQTSVGLAAFALFLTCLLRKLRETEIPAPIWLVRVISLILCNPVRSLLGLNGVEHKREAEESGNNGQAVRTPKDRTWNELATILEWMSTAVVLLIYIIMLTVVLQPNKPTNPEFR